MVLVETYSVSFITACTRRNTQHAYIEQEGTGRGVRDLSVILQLSV